MRILETQVARLNLTIPDLLYARLERWRERVNVSRVCALALEKELAMLEASPSGSEDPRVQRLLQRLQTHQERWYQRGYEDGERWTIDEGSLDQIRLMGEEWEDDGEYNLEEEAWEEVGAAERIQRWVLSDLGRSGEGRGRSTDSEEFEKARGAVDEWSYMNGWHYAVRDLWEKAEPRLSRIRDRH
jgi:hypothetical protein